MNKKYQNYKESELEIDLIDMMFYLIKHWRSLLLVVVAGILFGCGISVLKKPVVDNLPVIVEEYTPTEADLNNMELANEYKQLYEDQSQYRENSLLMQIDADNVYEGKLRYYILAGSDTEYIGLLYQNILNSEDVLDALKTASGLKCDNKYIREILSCVVSRGEDFYIGDTEDSFLKAGNYIVQNVVIDYKISYSDKEICEKMLSALSDEVEKVHAECSQNYSDYDMRQINHSVTQTVRTDIANLQKNCMDLIGAYLTNIEKYEDAFDEKALAYYKTEYLGEVVNDESEEVQAPAEVETVSVRSMVKWLFAGTFFFCLCWVVVLVFFYVFAKRVRIPKDLEKTFHMPVFGRMRDLNKGKNNIDRRIETMRKDHLKLADDIEYVIHSIIFLEKQKIVLCGNSKNQLFIHLSEKLQKSQMGVVKENFVCQDGSALDAAKNSDGVILLIELNETTYDDVRRELAVCHMQEIPVLGAVIVG